MKPILSIEKISKNYKIFHENEPYETLGSKIMKPWKFFKKRSSEEFWALKDISFEVQAGEAIGIIGKNGAGKSTLLKVLSKMTPPTTGKITARGRIASLLEVGTGFHFELTGRENIFLNGAILGMRRSEITRKFDAIVDFSGIEQFLDTPLKHYSSGMQLRLAFSVASFLENEVLIIDEVLAVGDAEFQKKCMNKAEQVSREQGRTVILVSHDLNAISNLTKKTLYLKKGQLVSFTDTDKAIVEYTDRDAADQTYSRSKEGLNKPAITACYLETTLPKNVQHSGKEMKIHFEIFFPFQPSNVTWLNVYIYDRMNRAYTVFWISSREINQLGKPGLHKITLTIPNINLYMGNYHLTIDMTGPPGQERYELLKDVCEFEVMMVGIERDFKWLNNEAAYIEKGRWSAE